MSRKPKGPTPEELIQNLQDYVDEYKDNNEKNLESIKSENEKSHQAVQENIANTDISLSTLKQEIDQKTIEQGERFEKIEGKQSNTEIIITEQSEKISALEQTLENMNSANEVNNENVQSQIDKLNENLEKTMEDMKKNINDHLENIKTVITEESERKKIKKMRKLRQQILKYGSNFPTSH